MTDNSAAIAATLRQVSRNIADLADLLDGNIPGASDRVAREVTTLYGFLYGFPMSPEHGCQRHLNSGSGSGANNVRVTFRSCNARQVVRSRRSAPEAGRARAPNVRRVCGGGFPCGRAA